ncbi:MAG: hypothetical protein LBJ12_03560 [Oscillospiraceae bacterium]|jgi:hypothetical protein|nr:hypothetical protein [Oscillospiraceae bacterium]
MKHVIKIYIVLVLIISAFTVCYAVAYHPEQKPQIPETDYSSIQPLISAEQAEVLASIRINGSGVSTKDYKWVAYQSVGTRHYPPYYQYTPDNLTWYITYYPKAWGGKDSDTVNCFFAELDGLNGKLLYSGKCSLTGSRLSHELRLNGTRLEHPAVGLDSAPMWDVSEYFLGDNKVRIIKTLTGDSCEYYTYDLKSEKVSDRLVLYTSSPADNMAPIAKIKYVVSEKEYVNAEYLYSYNDFWSLIKDGKTQPVSKDIHLDLRTLLPI